MTETITRQGVTYEKGRRAYQIAAEHVIAGDKIRDIVVLKAERTGTQTLVDGAMLDVIEITLDSHLGGFRDSRGWETHTFAASLGTAAEESSMYSPFTWAAGITPAE